MVRTPVVFSTGVWQEGENQIWLRRREASNGSLKVHPRGLPRRLLRHERDCEPEVPEVRIDSLPESR